jgi:WD40 repeat protein
MLIVLSREGTKWLIDFTDFLNPELEGMMGRFEPLAWSVDGRFLYFTKILGWDSGGNQCFPGIGVFGLYRLHLRTGNLTTLVSSDDFSGNEIRFSPTKEYYAVAGDGIKITNLINGKITAINNSGVIAMSWSPDGKYLAFSVASCGEILVESSSIFVWDSKMDQTKALYTTEEMLLRPISWIDNSNLRFEGEKWDGNNNYYTIFEYALAEDRMLFSGTETPQP